ncbi:alpha-amylase family glycosyl hydrolase [Pontibacter rugosus]|uniref:Alpha-amylase family glycosyl hydrolase n=1 Tax=Pontibacter rugosus TaxID=1745966 RepID=A0ABW3SJQ8_9BACT
MKVSTPILKYIIAMLLLFAHLSVAQVVITEPALPAAGKEVTLLFDISKAKDSRAQGLLKTPDQVFLWSGAGTSEGADAFEVQPAGQTNWSAPFEPGRMTYLGNSKWKITLVPRTYFAVQAGTPIHKLGLLLKNANGSAQTEDFIIQIYSEALTAKFQQPSQRFLFKDANSTIELQAAASAPAAMRILLDGVELKREENAQSISYTLNAGTDNGKRHQVVLEAKAASEVATDTFYYLVAPKPSVAALPAGLKDGINYISKEEVILVLFAPHKEHVYVIGEFNKWLPQQEYLMHRTPDGERYWLKISDLPAGKEIAYQYLVDGTIAVADPYADKILDPANDNYLTEANYPGLKPYPKGATGIVSVLQTQQPAYTWEVKNYERPAVEQLVIYELLIRDFVATRNYRTLTDTLSYFKSLGINAIELMPVMEFSGNDSWGYNPTFFFAPDKAYGTEEDLKTFIDAAHQAGIAVILDIVLNQADFENPYVRLYWDGDKPAANNPYFNPVATHPYNVFFDFNHESPATKQLVKRVTAYWLEEYKVDGFRFDLSKGFTQTKTDPDVNAWSAYDAGRVATWKRIYDEIREVDEAAYVILEHFADEKEEKELANYGMLLWNNANHDFRNLAKGQNTNPGWISYKQRGWQQPNAIGYIESHDEERVLFDVVQNGKASGTYNTRDLTTALNRAKLAAAFSLAVPGPKMIWQFGELGYDVSIDQNGRTGNKPLHWEYQNDPERAKLFQVYAELIKLKTTVPVFATDDFHTDFIDIVKRLTLSTPEAQVFMIGNFDVKQQSIAANFPQAGTWYDYFGREEVQVTNPAEKIVLQPGEFRLFTTKKLEAATPDLLPWTQTVLAADDELAKERGFVLYPNPAPDKVMVRLDNAYRGQVVFQVLDGLGRLVLNKTFLKTEQVMQQEMYLSSIPDGLYYMQISGGNEHLIRKIVKQQQ